MRVEGYFLDGKTSKQSMACLEVVRGVDSLIRLTVKDGDSGENVREMAFSGVRIESRIGSTPREIVLENKGLFVCEDHYGVDQLSKCLRKSRITPNFLYRLESNFVFVLAGLIICVVTSWVTVVYGVPKAATYLAFQMPEFIKDNLGSSLPILDKAMFKPSELSEKERVRIKSLMAEYNQAFEDLNPSLHFRLGMGANAFALPSGDIVFTDDFVHLTQTDDELRSVYFHELGHLAHKHMTRRALQGAMLSVAVILITGDVESFDVAVGIPVLLNDLSYSRDFEREADSFAFDAMQHYGIPLHSFTDVMQRLEEYYKKADNVEGEGIDKSEKPLWLKYLSTHPSTQERIDRVKELSKTGAE